MALALLYAESMPRTNEKPEKEIDDREPDERTEGERMQSASRQHDASTESDEDELSEYDFLDVEPDLDAAAKGDGPDA
jgi:hypothetical protein